MADSIHPNWSATFDIAPQSRVASKGLQGDKILLPPSALEQLILPSTMSEAGPYVSSSEGAHSRTPENPLMFCLVNQQNRNRVYAGVREFSAEDGEVGLSPYLMEALGVKEGTDGFSPNAARPQITVMSQQLPKGTNVRLRPLEAGYDPDDWKSLLERQLRANFTTLTKDVVLSVRGVKQDEFRFLVDRFLPQGDGICVVDTDLEVDIEALDEEQARETLRKIAAKQQKPPESASGSSAGHAIDIWKPVRGRVLAGDYVDYELPTWAKSRPLIIELCDLEVDHEIDLFASPRSPQQRALPRDSEHVFGNFSSSHAGSKRLLIQPADAALDGAEAILISVHGYVSPGSNPPDSEPRSFTLRARVGEADPAVSTSPSAPSGSSGEAGEASAAQEQCGNCREWVPKKTLVLHENFCRRHIVVCHRCSTTFHKSSDEYVNHWHCNAGHPDAYGSTPLSKAKHDHIQHSQHICPSCGPHSPFIFPSMPELAGHRTTVCPGKIILCQFCHLEVAQEGDPLDPSSEAETLLSGLTAHERADGARTTDCHLCGSIVRLRDMRAHLRNHDLDKARRPKPEICRNALCGRTIQGMDTRGPAHPSTRIQRAPNNDLGLCSICFSPLYVSIHDPEGRALRKRVERKYLAQLMSGCGKKHCLNEWCKTGRAHLDLENLAGSTGAVRSLMVTVDDTREPMNLCVDEGTQKRRKLAEALAAEDVWDLEWCIAAVEFGQGEVSKARGWLGDWAPMKP